jgi:hypothetical protein
LGEGLTIVNGDLVTEVRGSVDHIVHCGNILQYPAADLKLFLQLFSVFLWKLGEHLVLAMLTE